MAQPFFVWKDIDSRNMKVLVNEYPPFMKPKKRVTTLNVPGRPSVLTILDSDYDYESTVQICQCTAQPGTDISALVGWLDGSGVVRFGYSPDFVHKARISDQFDLDKLLRGHPHKAFNVPFICDPFKYLFEPGPDITIRHSSTTIHNPGTVASEPQLLVTGSGTVTLITGTGGAVELDGGTGPWSILIDSEMKDCLTADKSGFLNDWMTGDFPMIPPGDNNIAWTGNITSVVITPNWRWLG